MKKIIIASFLVLGFTGGVIAQNTQPNTPAKQEKKAKKHHTKHHPRMHNKAVAPKQ